MIEGFVNLHKIINYPLGGVNRDLTGAPKTFVSAGVHRAYISSASTKRAIRRTPSFAERNDGVRTQMLPTKICQDVSDKSEKARKYVLKVLNDIGLSSKSSDVKPSTSGKQKKDDDLPPNEDEQEVGDGKSKHCPYVSRGTIKSLVELFNRCENLDHKEVMNQAASIIKTGMSDDLAVFGRMLILSKSKQNMNVEAALAVANAISTHEVEVSRDILTAVDDCASDSSTGFKGERTMTSACMYVNAVLSLKVLYQNLKEDEQKTIEVARDVVKAFALFYHTGGKNVSAPFVPTSGVLVEVSTGMPINHCNAFDPPVRGGGFGIIQASIDRLAKFARADDAVFDAPARKVWYSYGGLYPLKTQDQKDVADDSCSDPNTLADIVAQVISGKIPCVRSVSNEGS